MIPQRANSNRGSVVTETRAMGLVLVLFGALAPGVAPAAPAKAPATASVASNWRPPAPVLRTLDNGLTVAVFVDHRLPVVQVQLVVPAGTDQESNLESGAAHLVAEGLTLGTITRSSENFAAEAARIGGRFGATASREYVALSGGFLASGLSAGVELLADAARQPTLLEEQIESVKDRVLGNLVRARGDASALSHDHARALGWGAQAVGHPDQGVIRTVERLSAAQLRDFHRRCYRPDRALLAVAGDVDPAEVFRLAEEHFGSWAGRSPDPGTIAPAPGEKLRIRLIDADTRGNAELAMVLPGPAHRDADAAPLMLAAARFEEQQRGAARLRSVASPRLDYERSRVGGLTVVTGSTAVDSVPRAIRALRSVIQSLGTTTESDVRALRERLRGESQMALDTPGGWIAQWAATRVHGGTEAEYSASVERWSRIGTEDVRRAVDKWWKRPGGWLVVVGPAARLRAPLEALGVVEVVSADEPTVGVPTLPSENLAPPSPGELAEGRRLITEAVAAHGGRSALERIKDTILEGSIRLALDGDQQLGTFREVRLPPDHYLQATLVQNVPVHQALDGTSGWLRGGGLGDSVLTAPEPMLAEMRANQRGDFLSILRACSDPAARTAGRGKEHFGALEVDVVEVIHPERGRFVLFLDGGNHRVLAADETRTYEGQSVIVRHRYGDLRKTGDVTWPYYEDRSVQGELVLVLQLSSLRINSGVDASVFARPRSGTRISGIR
ncbi:MAG: insulinase family protein [Candidatus Eisenbacteria bacterium]|uniref:Insulinase family protein n=1 Tax=Eiseniibacteriota bacterium TaxID=2212470 RepID=A0A849SS57_UNCEI|nr:insulinase family protein [Candidatus Eisenbacteria bacterium]